MLWVAVVAVSFRSTLSDPRSMRHQELLEHSLLAVTGIVVVLAAVLLAAAFARRIAHEVAGLAVASETADERLPQLVEALQSGEQPAPADLIPAQLPASTAEMAQTAAAIPACSAPPSAAAAARPGCATASGRSSSAWPGGTSRCCNGSCA